MDVSTCDQCGKGNASIQYTEIAEGQISKLHLCRSCAQSHGLLADEEPGTGVDALISKISQPESITDTGMRGDVLVCAGCKLSWAEFERHGLLGCEECYATFATRLLPLMQDFHQADQHVGAGRRRASDPATLLPELRALLEQAIVAEDYEKAAMLRDRIQAAEAADERRNAVAEDADDATDHAEGE